MEHNAHTLPGSDERGDTNHKAKETHDPPSTTCAAQSKDDACEKTSDDAANTQSAGEDDTRAVAVADGPADKVGVSLATQRPLYSGDHVLEGRWVGRVLQGVQQSSPLLRREVELPRSAISDIDRDDAVYLLAVGLDGDCCV